MLSPKVAGDPARLLARGTAEGWLFEGDIRPANHNEAVELACQKARRLSHSPSRSRPIRSGTHSLFICWNPAQMSARFNCCSATAAWRLPPAISGSPPAKCALHRARSICFLVPSRLSPSPPCLSTSERRPDGSAEVGSGGRFPPLWRNLSRTAWRVDVQAQRRVMNAIEVCRTAALGGHLERCDQCGHERNCFQ